MARIYLTNLDSDVTGYKLALVDQRNPTSTALATSVTDTAASGVKIQATATAGGTALAWITKPFLADVAFAAGPILTNVWAKESAAAANANVGAAALFEYTTSEQATFADTSPAPAELGTTVARAIFVSTNLTGTTIDAGNRLAIKLYITNTGTMGASQTVTIDFDGPTEGADGDTFIELNEAIRLSERQMKNGTYPSVPGYGQGFYQNIIDGLNAAAAAQVIDITAIQTVIDDLGYERDNQ